MRAAWYDKLGEAKDVLQVGEMPKPTAGPGEVLVHVRFSGVNPSDVKRRGGRSVNATRFPRIIPHQDGSGTIEAVGVGVKKARVGERVWVYEAQAGRPFGTAAEWVAVPSGNAVRLPEGIDFETGAALAIPAMTAHACLFEGGPIKGHTVLVSGGAGSCGNCAVQLARWAGAKVITTVSSDEKADVAREAGADWVLNYKREDVAARVKEIVGDAGVDRVAEVSLGANLALDAAVLKRGGTIAAYSSDSEPEPRFPFARLMSKNLTMRFILVYAMSAEWHRAAAQDINGCLAAGALRPHIARVFPLSDIVSAHEAVERGTPFGKILVSI